MAYFSMFAHIRKAFHLPAHPAFFFRGQSLPIQPSPIFLPALPAIVDIERRLRLVPFYLGPKLKEHLETACVIGSIDARVGVRAFLDRSELGWLNAIAIDVVEFSISRMNGDPRLPLPFGQPKDILEG